MISWIMNHPAETGLILMALERVTKETPKTWKPFGIPVGEYDNQVVDWIKQKVAARLARKPGPR